MNTNTRNFLTGALACATVITLSSGCATKQDTVAQAKKSAPQYTAAEVPHPDDGQNAHIARLKNLRGERYMEFMLVGSVPVAGDFIGTCYNTTGRNIVDNNRDSCPAALVAKLNPEELAKANNCARVWLNPPRYWLLDWIDIELGKVREFGGIEATWCALMNMPKGEWKPWTTTTIARKSQFGFAKGSSVYLVEDPEGNTWIMKSVSPSVSPENSYDNLATVGQRLKLPPGWKFRTAVLDKELVLIPTSDVARILKDGLDNVYDLTGPGYSNFKP